MAGTYATVREAVRLIREGTLNPKARLLAMAALRGVAWKDRLAEARAIFAHLRRHFRFTYDPEGAEMLQDLDAILENRHVDCDDWVILSGSVLRSVGIPVRIVIIASDPRAPDAFSHIYLQAEVRPGRWVGFDPSVVDATVGWEPPRFTRKEVIEIGD